MNLHNSSESIGTSHPPRAKHIVHRAAAGARNILVPPIAGRWHGRYRNRGWHLFFDTILSLLLFVLAGLSVFFIANSSFLVTPSLSLRLYPPSQMTTDPTVGMLAVVTNSGTTTVEGATLELRYPVGVQAIEVSPEPANAEKTLWHVPSLPPGKDEFVRVTLSPSGTAQTRSTLLATLRYPAGRATATKTGFATWEVPDADLALSIAAPDTLENGERGTIVLTVQNSGKTALAGNRLSGYFQLGLPQELEVVEVNPDAASTDQLLQWHLQDLPPGASRTTTVVVRATAEDLTVTIHAEAWLTIDNSQQIRQKNLERQIVLSGSSSIATIAEQPDATVPLQFAAEAHYFSQAGVQFGYGPLPPQVGETTGYRLFWTVRCGNQPLSRVTVSATLSSAASWGGHATVTHGDGISYDDATRTVTWDIGTIDQSDGSISGSFEVTLTPTSGDRGLILQLLLPSTVRATKGDATMLTKTMPSLTTDLPGPLERHKGAIQE